MNRNDQQAYDRGTSLFSPDGRIYQVEYAREAVRRGAPSLGVRTADGVVLAAQSRPHSKLMEAESIEKLHKIDEHIGAASAGHVADARQLVDFARDEAQVNRLRYEEPIGVGTLARSITDHIQESTQYGGTRPFGASLLIGGMDGDQPRLFGTDPSGTSQEWKAVAIGGERDATQEFLEESYEAEMSLDDGVSLAIGALREVVEDLEASDASIATITADGYRVLATDEIPALEADSIDDESADDGGDESTDDGDDES